jgi:hypothetical protein
MKNFLKILTKRIMITNRKKSSQGDAQELHNDLNAATDETQTSLVALKLISLMRLAFGHV